MDHWQATDGERGRTLLRLAGIQASAGSDRHGVSRRISCADPQVKEIPRDTLLTGCTGCVRRRRTTSGRDHGAAERGVGAVLTCVSLAVTGCGTAGYGNDGVGHACTGEFPPTSPAAPAHYCGVSALGRTEDFGGTDMPRFPQVGTVEIGFYIANADVCLLMLCSTGDNRAFVPRDRHRPLPTRYRVDLNVDFTSDAVSMTVWPSCQVGDPPSRNPQIRRYPPLQIDESSCPSYDQISRGAFINGNDPAQTGGFGSNNQFCAYGIRSTGGVVLLDHGSRSIVQPPVPGPGGGSCAITDAFMLQPNKDGTVTVVGNGAFYPWISVIHKGRVIGAAEGTHGWQLCMTGDNGLLPSRKYDFTG